MPNAAPKAFCNRKMDMMKLFILAGASRASQIRIKMYQFGIPTFRVCIFKSGNRGKDFR